jgi:hypothetical protein
VEGCAGKWNVGAEQMGEDILHGERYLERPSKYHTGLMKDGARLFLTFLVITGPSFSRST